MGRKLGDPDDPLLVSVRSGAKFSMPGMMETVLNVGLTDESVAGLAQQAGGDERFAWDSYRRLIQMFGKTVCNVPGRGVRARARRREARQGRTQRSRSGRGRSRTLVNDVQEDLQGVRAPRLPAGPARADGSGHEGGLRVVERRPGRALPAAGAHPGRPRHGRQHRGDGLRQPRRRQRHRRRVHPRSGHRRARRLRRLPAERAG